MNTRISFFVEYCNTSESIDPRRCMVADSQSEPIALTHSSHTLYVYLQPFVARYKHCPMVENIVIKFVQYGCPSARGGIFNIGVGDIYRLFVNDNGCPGLCIGRVGPEIIIADNSNNCRFAFKLLSEVVMRAVSTCYIVVYQVCRLRGCAS